MWFLNYLKKKNKPWRGGDRPSATSLHTTVKLTKISVSAARTFNHPYERYANFRFEIRLEGEIEDNMPIGHQIDSARESAENIAENHKLEILDELQQQQQRELIRESIATAREHQRHAAEIEEQIASGKLANYYVDVLKGQLDEITKIPEWEAKLAAMPSPRLLPEREIHPGHEDHPDTHNDNGTF